MCFKYLKQIPGTVGLESGFSVTLNALGYQGKSVSADCEGGLGCLLQVGRKLGFIQEGGDAC